MARARNVKPGLFKNEILGVADPMLTLLFEGLWCLADREGRLEDRPLKIKGELFPYRDGLDVNGYLTELQRMGFIVRYVANDQSLIQVVKFKKHQTPHNTEKPSELPAPNAGSLIPCGSQTLTVKDALNNSELTEAKRPDLLIPDSLNTDSVPASAATTATPPRKPSKKKSSETPIPEDFGISDSVKAWAVVHGHTNLKAHLEFFVGRMRANGKLYVDWDQAFQNCIREDWAKLRLQPNTYGQANAPPAKPILPIEEQVPSLKAQRGEKPEGMGSLKSLIKPREAA